MAESPSGRESGGGGGAAEEQGPEDLRSDSKKKAAGEGWAEKKGAWGWVGKVGEGVAVSAAVWQ